MLCAAFVFVFLVYVSLYFGLYSYLRAWVAIVTAGSANREVLQIEFFGDENTPSVYRGILAGIGSRRIWIWGKNGLKHFDFKENTNYVYIDFCSKGINVVTRMFEYPGSGVPSYAFSDPKKFSGVTSPGDIALVLVSVNNEKKTFSTMDQVWVHSRWPHFKNNKYTPRCIN